MSPALYEHVEEKCNLEPIKDLLRVIKARNENANAAIPLQTTKKEAVGNLKLAVDSGYADVNEVLALLRSAEETGRQHILLLTPATEELEQPKSMRAADVVTALFGEPANAGFPRFEYPSSGFSWSDFRYNDGSDDWTAKAYGLEVIKASVGVTTEDLGDGRIQEIREYVFKEVKTLLVARWDASSNILEVRIDVSGIQNSQTLEDRRAAFWRLIEPAFSSKNFVGVNVEKLMENLVFLRDSEDNKSKYSISRIELTDPRSGLVRLLPFQSEDFDRDPGRTTALEAMRQSGFVPSSARIDWKPAEHAPDSMKEPISAVLEKTENGPELRILKRIPSEVYDYVFNQIRSRLE